MGRDRSAWSCRAPPGPRRRRLPRRTAHGIRGAGPDATPALEHRQTERLAGDPAAARLAGDHGQDRYGGSRGPARRDRHRPAGRGPAARRSRRPTEPCDSPRARRGPPPPTRRDPGGSRATTPRLRRRARHRRSRPGAHDTGAARDGACARPGVAPRAKDALRRPRPGPGGDEPRCGALAALRGGRRRREGDARRATCHLACGRSGARARVHRQFAGAPRRGRRFALGARGGPWGQGVHRLGLPRVPYHQGDGGVPCAAGRRRGRARCGGHPRFRAQGLTCPRPGSDGLTLRRRRPPQRARERGRRARRARCDRGAGTADAGRSRRSRDSVTRDDRRSHVATSDRCGGEGPRHGARRRAAAGPPPRDHR